MSDAACRTCQAPIIWATTQLRGKTIPLDATPVLSGTYRLVAGLAVWVPAGGRLADESLYQCHFVTCPDREQHKRRGK